MSLYLVGWQVLVHVLQHDNRMNMQRTICEHVDVVQLDGTIAKFHCRVPTPSLTTISQTVQVAPEEGLTAALDAIARSAKSDVSPSSGPTCAVTDRKSQQMVKDNYPGSGSGSGRNKDLGSKTIL